MVEEKIYNYLRANLDLPARQIGWGDEPTGTAYPRVTFKKMSDPPLYQSTDTWQRWRFYVAHEDKFECKAIVELIVLALHGFYGLIEDFYFDFISKIDEGPIELREDNIYEIYVDFRVKYH